MTEPSETYLNELPDASAIVQSNLELRQAQTAVVVDRVRTLSADNPFVTFDLEAPLDDQLSKELIDKGYSLSRTSRWTSENGHVAQSHQVTVALPAAGNRWAALPTCPFRRTRTMLPWFF